MSCVNLLVVLVEVLSDDVANEVGAGLRLPVIDERIQLVELFWGEADIDLI